MAAAWRHQRQHCGGKRGGSAATAAAAACRQRGGGGGGQRVGSATAAGMAVAAAATAVLPPRAAAVAMKTPATTAMVGAQTTINNQLKSMTATETGTMTATTMRMETKATVAAVESRRPAWQRWRQLGESIALAAAASLAAEAAAWQERGVGGGDSTAAA